MIQPRLFGQPQTELTSDDYYTPRWVFDTLGLRFDLDVASPPGGPPFVPCERYFTQEDDGLAQPWHGRVWMNPPFSKTGPWMERFLEHANGVALVPSSNGSWYDMLWNSSAAITIGPKKFDFVNGSGHGIPRRIHFVAIGPENVEAIQKFGKVR